MNDRPTPPPIETAGRAYEELEGAQGREIFFRPIRYRPADLAPITVSIEVVFADTRHVCVMQDVSQSGVAFTWPLRLAPPQPRTHLAQLIVRFDDHEAYNGAAVVVTARALGGTVIVGASLSDALLDIETVLHVREVRGWATERARLLSRTAKYWHVEGYERFQSIIAEFRLFLEDAAEELAATEVSLPWKVVHGESDSPARVALVETLRRGFVEDMIHFTSAADREVRRAGPAAREALKHFTQKQLDAHLLQAPILLRAKTKPFGYPGDFEVMRFVYERTFEGSSLFAKALHLATVNLPGSACIRTRKDLVKSEIAARARALRAGQTLRVASIAAGPAQEVYELLRELDHIEGTVEVVLFDQDPAALQFAFGRLTRLVDARWGARVRIRFLHDSIKRLLRDPELFRDHAPFDAVICAGLFDYLDTDKAAVLVSSLYRAVRPGGVVYAGNYVPEQPTRWLLEHHLDWNLLYKTRDEMLAFASRGAPDARLAILEESVGYCPFVTVTRPA
jgi:extracellular factor (EF) 3-hydroxypalmitic acid methyl ester biosynthesis protein